MLKIWETLNIPYKDSAIININNAIRKDKRIKYDSKGFKYIENVWVFICLGGCKKELICNNYDLKHRTGYCVKCVKRKDIHPYQHIFNSVKYSAKREDKEFNLTFKDFLEWTRIKSCIYCGKDVEWKQYQQGPGNLDRKDSSRGYIKNNIVICCFECNRMKSGFFTFEEFRIIRRLYDAYQFANEFEKKELEFEIFSLPTINSKGFDIKYV